jgi:drug/metabolite transporter (DMT)-like permease
MPSWTGTRATVAAIFYIFLWAAAFVPSKVAVMDASPLLFLVVRFLFGGTVLMVLAWALRLPFPRSRRAWLAIAALGVLSNSVYLGFNYEALRSISAGMGAILASTNPLILALAAPYVLHEPLTVRKGLGLLVGFSGVVLIMLSRTGTQDANVAAVALVIVAVCGNVAGTLVFKRLEPGAHLLAISAIQLTVAGLALLPFAFVVDAHPHISWTPRLIASFVYLFFSMSLVATVLWYWLLRNGEASKVSAYFFLTPIFGLALGALVLGEPTSPRDLIGLAATAAGIALVQSG